MHKYLINYIIELVKKYLIMCLLWFIYRVVVLIWLHIWGKGKYGPNRLGRAVSGGWVGGCVGNREVGGAGGVGRRVRGKYKPNRLGARGGAGRWVGSRDSFS